MGYDHRKLFRFIFENNRSSSTGALSTDRLQIQDDGDRKAGVYEVKDVKKEDGEGT